MSTWACADGASEPWTLRPVAAGLDALRDAVRLVAGLADDNPPAGEVWRTSTGQSGARHSPRPYPRPAPRRPAPSESAPTVPRPAGRATVPAPGGGPEEPRRTDVWDLVARAQEGDAEAFGQIYDRYAETVFKFVYFRVNSRTLAEDLTSDTFLRALRRIGSVTWQGRDLGAWLVTIARNLIADHYKSGRFRLEVTTADMLDADTTATGPEGRPESAVLERMTNDTLLAAVKQLNAEQQECITLRFLQDRSVTETAQIMGKNEGAIKALQYRAVRALGRLLPDGFRS